LVSTAQKKQGKPNLTHPYPDTRETPTTAHRKREHVHNASLSKASYGPVHRRENIAPNMVAMLALIVDGFVLSAYKSRGLRRMFGTHELDVVLKHRTV